MLTIIRQLNKLSNYSSCNTRHKMYLSSSICHHHSLPSSPAKLASNSTNFTINHILTNKNFVSNNLFRPRLSARYNSTITGSYGGGDRNDNVGTVQSSPAKKLRKLLDSPGIHQGPACFDALSAKLVEKAGFQFCFTTGTFWSIACSFSYSYGFCRFRFRFQWLRYELKLELWNLVL